MPNANASWFGTEQNHFRLLGLDRITDVMRLKGLENFFLSHRKTTAALFHMTDICIYVCSSIISGFQAIYLRISTVENIFTVILYRAGAIHCGTQ